MDCGRKMKAYKIKAGVRQSRFGEGFSDDFHA